MEEEKKSRILTREGVAKLLGISIASVDRYVRDGLIPHKRLKGRVLFSERDVRRFLFNDAALPKTAEERLDKILKSKMVQVEKYRKTAQRYLGLKRILKLFNKLEKLEKQPKSLESRQAKSLIEDELHSLLEDERLAEKKEREELKKSLREIKKEIKEEI
jgi:predicted DNA-binding transcriptional regulator AlpA